MKTKIIEQIFSDPAPDIENLLENIKTRWAEEQKKRHAFWATVDENTKAEYILGEVIYHSPVYGRHWKASTRICKELMPHVYNNKLGEIGVEKVMIRLTRNDYEPDICFWKNEKAQHFTEKQSAFPPPNFIIEILSKSTEERDRGIKMEDYALHGVEEYWLVDTESQTVEQYLLNGEQFDLSLKMNSGVLKSKVIEGFGIEVKLIFE